MRISRLRSDIWICMLIAALFAWLGGGIAERIAVGNYGNYEAEHAVAAGDIGGIAGDDIYRAQSIEDILTHEIFTVVSPGIEYRNRGSGFYGSFYMQALTLPSGEIVAAVINGDSVVFGGEDIFSGDNTLPVGRVVYEDLTENETFISQIEHLEPLSRRDFYVDMSGKSGHLSEEDYASIPKMSVQVIVFIAVFALAHYAGSQLGIFQAFYKRKTENEEPHWD